MIVADLYADNGTDRKPLERVEIWNIDASDPFQRQPISHICNYGYRIVRNPDSLFRTVVDEMFLYRSLSVHIANHDNRQSSWALLLKILEKPDALAALNPHWSARPKGAGDDIRIVMDLWPHGERSDCKTMTTMEIKKVGNGYDYTIAGNEKLHSLFSLFPEEPTTGSIQGNKITPWDVCFQALARLKAQDYFVACEPAKSDQRAVSKQQPALTL